MIQSAERVTFTHSTLEPVSVRSGSTERDVLKYAEVSTGLIKPKMAKKPTESLALPESRLAGAGCVTEQTFGERYWRAQRESMIAPKLGRAATGEVLADLVERQRSEITDIFSESLLGRVRTEYAFEVSGGQILGLDGEPMEPMLERWVEQTDKMAEADRFYQSFLPARSRAELAELHEQQAMAKGECDHNLLVTFSCPDEDLTANKANHPKLKLAGQKPQWLRSMIRASYWDGQKMHIFTRSFDNLPKVLGKPPLAEKEIPSLMQILSDIASRQFNYQFQATEPAAMLNERIRLNIDCLEDVRLLADMAVMTGDQILSEYYGGDWKAGRPANEDRDTIAFIGSHHEVVDEALILAAKSAQTAKSYDQFAKRFGNQLYDLIALLETGYETGRLQFKGSIQAAASGAGAAARSNGRVYDACGLVLAGDQQKTASLTGYEALFGLLRLANQYVVCPQDKCQKLVLVPTEALTHNVLYCRECGYCLDICGDESNAQAMKLQLDLKYKTRPKKSKEKRVISWF